MGIFEYVLDLLGLEFTWKEGTNHYHVKQKETEEFQSTIGIKSTESFRNVPMKCAEEWLHQKRIEDDINGLWRVHDDLYDFSSFISKHPGGESWLTFSKGTDITELFEAHHISSLPESLLSQYRINSAHKPRKSPFTFEENGFYRTLKKKVRLTVGRIPKKSTQLTKLYADLVFVAVFILAIGTNCFSSYALGAAAGIALTYCMICGHNFYHKRDNFRMYYFDMGLLSSKEWRVMHILSHHIFTNTAMDFEMVGIEPLVHFLPHKKALAGFTGVFFFPVAFLILLPIIYIRRWMMIFCNNKGLHKITISVFVPFSIPFITYSSSAILGYNSTLLDTFYWWIYMNLICSEFFGILSIGAGHHLPDVFHDGDTPRDQKDWGIYQLDTLKVNTGTLGSSFLVLLHFGEHALHHLFPTLDHGQLPYLHECLQETSQEFGIELRNASARELIAGNFKQIVRQTPNRLPPGYKSN